MTDKLRETVQQVLRQMERSESNLHKARAALREALMSDMDKAEQLYENFRIAIAKEVEAAHGIGETK